MGDSIYIYWNMLNKILPNNLDDFTYCPFRLYTRSGDKQGVLQCKDPFGDSKLNTVAQAVTEHALLHQAVQLVLESMRELTPIARQLDWGLFCCGIGPDLQTTRSGERCGAMRTCLPWSETKYYEYLFTSLYLRTVGDVDGHTPH